MGVIVALAISSTIVDVSPFSTNGALVLANAQGVDRDVFYKQILKYSALVVAIGPLDRVGDPRGARLALIAH